MTKRLILVVDDDMAIRDFITMALQEEGYEVATAEDGNAALRLAAERQPTLILLDMRMPRMDGATFIQKYKQIASAHAPIVVLTAGREVTQSAESLGVNGFLPKPFNLDELLDLVEHYAPSNPLV